MLCWRDDGLLPAMSGLDSSFSRHWPLTGRGTFLVERLSLEAQELRRLQRAGCGALGGFISSSTAHAMLGLLVETNLGEDRSLQLRSKELAAVLSRLAADENALPVVQ